jgi:hypothetical protein
MNLERINGGTSAALGFLTVGGIFAVLAVVLVFTLKAPPIDAARAAERQTALAEIRAAESKSLAGLTTIDPQKGIVRLPIERAMELTAQAWQNPAAARTDLISRVEKATATPPPAAAEPSAFE